MKDSLLTTKDESIAKLKQAIRLLYPLSDESETNQETRTKIMQVINTLCNIRQEALMKIAEAIIDAMHLEAEWSKRSLPVVSWHERSAACHESLAKVIEKHLTAETLPSPEEQHQIWVDEHLKMGWKYGKERDLVNKTHPNLVPYSDLPDCEKSKDALFLTLVALVKMLIEKDVVNL